MKLTRTASVKFLCIISHNPNQFMLIDLIQQADKLLFDVLAQERPRLPCVKGAGQVTI